MEDNSPQKAVITEDIEIVGSVKASGNIELHGKLNGDLSCNGNAVIGAKANVKGNITVDSITLMGQINGNISAKDRIELKSSARLTGDIRAKRLTVEDGVTFVGKSEVTPSGTGGGRGPAEAKSQNAEAAAEENENEPENENTNKGGFLRKH